MKIFIDVAETNGTSNPLFKLKSIKKRRAKRITPVIDCETWRILRPATEEDNKRARRNIVERIKNAFWL